MKETALEEWPIKGGKRTNKTKRRKECWAKNGKKETKLIDEKG